MQDRVHFNSNYDVQKKCITITIKKKLTLYYIIVCLYL